MGIASGEGSGLSTILYVFGDSLSTGSGATQTDDAFPVLIAKTKKWDLRNLAVGGTRLGDDGQIGVIRRTAFNKNHVVVFLTGYNDMRFTGTDTTGQNAYATLLDETLDKFEAAQCTVYLGNCITMKSASYALDPPYDQGSDTAVAQFNTKISTAASGRSNVTVVDVSTVFDPDTAGQMNADNVHPSSAGYSTIADTFLAEM